MRRVIMIGLDASSLDFITTSRQSLPTLRRLLDTGITQRFWSRSADLFPASVWPTFFTGTHPGRHGAYFPLQWDAASMSLRPAVSLLKCVPFWVELERRGHRVAAFDVPTNWVSQLRRGIEITDWGPHDETQGFSVQPKELMIEIRREFGTRSIRPEIPVRKSAGQLRRLRDEVIASTAKRAALVRWLLRRQDWDFFIAAFTETHRAGHLFWPVDASGRPSVGVPDGALLECYQAVDRALGEIVPACMNTNTVLIVFSVHGMGPNQSQEYFTRPIMDRINARFAGAMTGAQNSTPRSRRAVMRVLRERLPARLQHMIGRAVPLRWRDAVVNRAVTSGYDWSRTPGFAILGTVTGFVRFNLRGREKAGMLEPGSDMYRRYVRCVRDAFHSWRIADTDERLVKEVAITGEEFAGERSVYLPDVVVSWADRPPASRVTSAEFGVIDIKPPTGRAGNHRAEGFAIVVDPRHQQSGLRPSGDIVDLASTVQRLLENPARA